MFALLLCAAIAIAILVYMLMASQPRLKPGSSTRRSPRVPVSVPVHIETAQDRYHGDTQNVSHGGMLLRAQAPVSVAQPVELSFTLPDAEPVTIPAVVTHHRGEDVGVRFDPTHQVRRVIERWVDESQRKKEAALPGPTRG